MTLIHHYVIPVYAFISSCLDYCKALFSCPTKAFINCLQSNQKAAVKASNSRLYRSLHISPRF